MLKREREILRVDNKDCNTVLTPIDFCKTASLTRFCRHFGFNDNCNYCIWESNTGNAIITIDFRLLRSEKLHYWHLSLLIVTRTILVNEELP